MDEFWIEIIKTAMPFAGAATLYGIIILIKTVAAKKGVTEAQSATINKACDQAKRILDQTLFGAVTRAEQTFSSGQGQAKLDTVRQEILGLLPENVRPYLPEEWLKDAIEAGLVEAKKKWAPAVRLPREEAFE